MRKLTQSYSHGASSVPLIGETIGAFFDAAVERWGDRDALIVRHQNLRWSYAQLKDAVDDFAAGLLALGLVPGERIGIWSQNNAEWAVSQFATAKAGLILVNINPAYRLSELEYALNKVGAYAALNNRRSWRVMEKLGMTREAVLRSNAKLWDEYVDDVYYGVLRREWEGFDSGRVPDGTP